MMGDALEFKVIFFKPMIVDEACEPEKYLENIGQKKA
jgi:hypothetical protein